MDELRSTVGDKLTQCPHCEYQSTKADNLVKHLALSHGLLDKVLKNKSLVQKKRMKSLTKPKKVQIGTACPVCDFKDPPREHVSRHFMPELLRHLETLPDQRQCLECNYLGEKPQNLAKHIALVHSMLDKLLMDEDLVRAKREAAMSKPKKISIGDQCPVCEMAIAKRDSRVHVIWHFMDDLRKMVAEFEDKRICDLCGYQNDRRDKMAKHMALGHSKLDELLMDKELVQQKKAKVLSRLKSRMQL